MNLKMSVDVGAWSISDEGIIESLSDSVIVLTKDGNFVNIKYKRSNHQEGTALCIHLDDLIAAVNVMKASKDITGSN
jgi:hypothetical protein